MKTIKCKLRKTDKDCLTCPLDRCIYDMEHEEAERIAEEIQRRKRKECNERWRKTHMEHERRRAKKWYESHKEEILAKRHAYYLKKKGVKDGV